MCTEVNIILALGSNTQQQLHIDMAQAMLGELLGHVVFTHKLWTAPIDIYSDRFINCLGMASTTLSLDELNRRCKQIEAQCGDNREDRRRGIVRLDIDILLYGSQQLHENDWNRDYIRQLMRELTCTTTEKQATI